MKTYKDIIRIVVSVLLLLLGGYIAYGAVVYLNMHLFAENILPESYWISMIALLANLANGSLLIMAFIVFLINKKKGSRLYRLAGIMFVFYGFNLLVTDFLEIMNYNKLVEKKPILHGVDALLDPYLLLLYGMVSVFGAFIYWYYGDKTSKMSRKTVLQYVLIGLLFYVAVDFMFHDWFYK